MEQYIKDAKKGKRDIEQYIREHKAQQMILYYFCIILSTLRSWHNKLQGTTYIFTMNY